MKLVISIVFILSLVVKGSVVIAVLIQRGMTQVGERRWEEERKLGQPKKTGESGNDALVSSGNYLAGAAKII